jgi:hypothetical protein
VSQPATIEGARSIVEDLLDLRAEALEATRRLLAAIDATGEP